MATLPLIPAGTTLEEGQQFTIRGYNFDQWPSEIVMGYTSEDVETSDRISRLMALERKSQNEMVFRVQATQRYGSNHLWQYFGSPNQPPRTILEYETF